MSCEQGAGWPSQTAPVHLTGARPQGVLVANTDNSTIINVRDPRTRPIADEVWYCHEETYSEPLTELRRVCRGQLVMSVPFHESEPLSKGHVRRFEPSDIAASDPSAVGSVTSLSTAPVTDEQPRIAKHEDELARLRLRRAVSSLRPTR